MTQSNSYKSTLPDFSSLTAKEAQTNIKSLVKKQRTAIDKLLKNKQKINFESVVNPIEEMQHELSRTFSPISHLQNVLDQPEWRSTYNSCLPLLTDYGTELSQNTELEKAYKTIIDNLDDQKDPKFKLLEQELRNFTLNGVNLEKTKKQKFKNLKTRLSTAEATFSQNVQDSTDAWSLHINNEDELKGISREILEQAKVNQDGWKLILDYPTYHSVMTHAENRSLRERFYKAWSTRASDQAENTQWNNEENIKNILSLRHQLANIVGYKNFAEYSLATKMADSTNEIIDFLDDLAKKTKSTARNELTILEKAADHNLEAWDISYYLEKTKQQNYAISDEELNNIFQKKTYRKVCLM